MSVWPQISILILISLLSIVMLLLLAAWTITVIRTIMGTLQNLQLYDNLSIFEHTFLSPVSPISQIIKESHLRVRDLWSFSRNSPPEYLCMRMETWNLKKMRIETHSLKKMKAR